MLLRIKFNRSDLKSGAYCMSDRIKSGDIPTEEWVNIFTDEQLSRLNSILDSGLKVEQVNKYNLSIGQLYKDKPHNYLDEEDNDYERKNKANLKYEKNYNNSEFLDLYLIDSYSTSDTYIVDSVLLFTFMNDINNSGAKFKYEIVGSVKDVPTVKKDKTNIVLEKLLSLEENLNNFSQAQQFNTKVGVHISDLALMNVREVDVLYSPCTDELQDWLDKGWRILSICPQPDERRPDYIVGRNTPINGRKRRDID